MLKTIPEIPRFLGPKQRAAQTEPAAPNTNPAKRAPDIERIRPIHSRRFENQRMELAISFNPISKRPTLGSISGNTDKSV
jgi:hypothetical protein